MCRKYHITTYPTFRYYLNGVEHDYEDAQSLDALREFVDTSLAPQCDPIDNKSACSERARTYGEKWLTKSSSPATTNGIAILQNEIDRLERVMIEFASVTPELSRWQRQRKDILKIIQKHLMDEETDLHSVNNDEL